jgi:hypothetical protein
MTCPKCGNPVDYMSEHYFFDLDATVVGCTRCRLRNVAGSDESWLPSPSLGLPVEEYEAEGRRINAILRARVTGEVLA